MELEYGEQPSGLLQAPDQRVHRRAQQLELAHPVDAARTLGGPVNAVLVLQDDGNLVLYDTQSGDYRALWATGTDNIPADDVSKCDASSP